VGNSELGEEGAENAAMLWGEGGKHARVVLCLDAALFNRGEEE